MKYRTLILIASATKILAWVVIAIGILTSIRLGIIASSPLASVTFLLGGFIVTAASMLMLLAISKLIHLFLDMQQDLSEIARASKSEPED